MIINFCMRDFMVRGLSRLDLSGSEVAYNGKT